MIIRDPGSTGDLTETSPRYGFSITREMATALGPALDAYDKWEDNPLEHIEIAIREEVGLAHTLNYNIEHDFDLPDGIAKEYSRANGVWVSGFVCPDAPQFLACEEEMRRTGNLREGMYPHEAMIDDSLIYEPKESVLRIPRMAKYARARGDFFSLRARSQYWKSTSRSYQELNQQANTI
jgi:hypothetical protein